MVAGPSAEQRYVQQIRDEIDGYFLILKTLNSVPQDEAFAQLSSITARLSEIRTQLWRSDSRRLAALRNREIEPMLDTTDRLFRIHSRIVTTTQLEWDQVKGQAT